MKIINNDPVVILGGARTPIGKYLGSLKTVPTDDLGAIALKEALIRSKVSPKDINEVVTGYVMGTLLTSNISRVIALKAGLPVTSSAFTVNRLCGSGLQSILSGAFTLLSSSASFVAAGGVESLSRTEYFLPVEVRWQGMPNGIRILDGNTTGHLFAQPVEQYPDIPHMGNTAEKVVSLLNISREEQDRFALWSQQKAKKAQDSGRFAQEIVPVQVNVSKRESFLFEHDEHLRPETSLEQLSKLKPVFRRDEHGSVTAGNSSGVNDCAAFVILSKKSTAIEKNLPVMAEIVDYSITGIDPNIMGLGPVAAIKEILSNNNLTLDDIDLLEINEAFAGQTLGCLKELGIDLDGPFRDRFNPNGGAIALGHPLGMSGTRLALSAAYDLQNNPEKTYALVAACIGGGQGIAVLLKNPNK